MRARHDRLAGRCRRVGLVAAVCRAGRRCRDRPSRRSRPSWWTSACSIVASATGSGGVGSGTRLGAGQWLGHGVGRRLGDRLGRRLGNGLGRGVSWTRLLDGDLDRSCAIGRGGDLDLLGRDRLVGGAEEVGEGALAHAGALTPSHGPGPPSPGRGSALAALPFGSYLRTLSSADRRLGELDRLADPRLEDEVAEVLLEDLHRLLGVDGARVEHRRQDALDLDVRVEVLPDHLQRVLELDQPAHREVLALDGDDHLVRGGQRVDRQQPEARRRVDADEVVVVARPRRAPSRSERSRPIWVLIAISAPARSIEATAMSISRCDDDLADRHVGGRARRTCSSRPCPGRCPGSSSGCPAGPGRRRGRGGRTRRRRRRG